MLNSTTIFRIRRRLLVAVTMATFCVAARAADTVSNLKSDERVVFFPIAAHRGDDGRCWRATLHAWVFERGGISRRGPLLATALTASAGGANRSESELLAKRLAPFAVDNERGKTLVIRIGDKAFPLSPTESNGHSQTPLEIDESLATAHAADGRLTFHAVLPKGDTRMMTGEVHLIEPKGLSVISDIDDTIKRTEVRDKKQLLRNTFLRPFEPVEGMADVYRRWSSAGARFHFVSASPWQLYEPLAEFARDNRFPPATFHQRMFRLTDASFVALFQEPREAKITTITGLLRQWPQRRFVLVGDSGELDPEVYGEIARQFPRQVVRIFIRDVTDETRDAERYQAAMRDVADDIWLVFRDPQMMVLP